MHCYDEAEHLHCPSREAHVIIELVGAGTFCFVRPGPSKQTLTAAQLACEGYASDCQPCADTQQCVLITTHINCHACCFMHGSVLGCPVARHQVVSIKL